MMSALLKLASPVTKLQTASRNVFRWAVTAGSAVVFAGIGTIAHAAPATSAKLVGCGDESCLLVSGYRDNPDTPVKINGRSVMVEGGKSWEHRMPLTVLREWAEPHARSIDVSLQSASMQSDDVAEVKLPIGLLGNTTALDSIRVSVQ